MTMERRDQVLIGLRSFLAEATCTFFARCRSTKGPFFNERGISAYLVLAALQDHVIRALVVTRLQTLGVLAPRRYRMRIALTRLALAAPVRMIDRIHRKTAHRGADAAPAFCARLAVASQVVFVVPDLTDGRAAIHVHAACLGRLQTQRCVDAFARGVLHRAASAAGELPALAGLQFDVVHEGAERNVPQRHRIAGLDGRIGAGADFIAGHDALGRENVAALAILVEDERNVRGPVRIVFDGLNDARNAVLVALEVDEAVLLPRTAADMTRRDAAKMSARAGLALRHCQWRVRPALVQVRAVDLDDRAGAGGCRLVFDQAHAFALAS